MEGEASGDSQARRQTFARLEQMRTLCETGWQALCMASVFATLTIPSLCVRAGTVGALLSASIGAVWLLVVRWLWQDYRERRALELSLCAGNDVEAIGPLVEGLEDANRIHAASVRSALQRLLLGVGESQIPSLTRGQRQALRRALLYDADVDLALSILRAYETIGGRYEREILRMLADGIQTRTRDPGIQQAARRCLRRIHPAYTPLLLEDGLLRPAGSHAEPENDRLLRPC